MQAYWYIEDLVKYPILVSSSRITSKWSEEALIQVVGVLKVFFQLSVMSPCHVVR